MCLYQVSGWEIGTRMPPPQLRKPPDGDGARADTWRDVASTEVHAQGGPLQGFQPLHVRGACVGGKPGAPDQFLPDKASWLAAPRAAGDLPMLEVRFLPPNSHTGQKGWQRLHHLHATGQAESQLPPPQKPASCLSRPRLPLALSPAPTPRTLGRPHCRQARVPCEEQGSGVRAVCPGPPT